MTKTTPMPKTSRRSPARNPRRIINAPEYNAAVEARGSLPLDGLRLQVQTWRSRRDAGERGRPEVYADAFLDAILMLSVAFHLPLRQTRGVARTLIRDRRVSIPSIATLCRRRQETGVEAKILRRAKLFTEALRHSTREKTPLLLLVDSTGISIRGVGTWRSDKPGSTEHGRRSYWKLHTLIEPVTGQTLAATLESDPGRSDSSVFPELLGALPDGSMIAAVAADGAYDTRVVYGSLEKHGVKKSLVKPKETAKPWRITVPGSHLRIPLLTMEDRSRVTLPGSAAWKERTGYSVRSLIETSYSRLAALRANRPLSRSAPGRAGEVFLALELLNQHARLGMPERRSRRWSPPEKV